MTERADVPGLTRLPERLLRSLAGPLIAVLISFVLALCHNPFEVYAVLLKGGRGGCPNLAVTLQMMPPLVFTGLAVAVAFRAGIWNIGVEGQMLMGALAAGIAGYGLDLPGPIEVPACILMAILGGAELEASTAMLRVVLAVNARVVWLML